MKTKPTKLPKKVNLKQNNLGRDNLKTFKPSKEAQALQEQIANIGNFEPDFSQDKILARDLAYLKEQKLEKDRLIKELNKEEAKVEILRKKLVALQGKNLKDKSLSDQNPNTAPQSSTQERNLEPKTQIDFDKVYKRLFEVFEDDLIEISGEFIMFVQFVVDSLNQNLGSEFENTKFENWQDRNGTLNSACFPNIVRILQAKYSFEIFKSEIELKINLSCNKLLFNWIKNGVNNPKLLQPKPLQLPQKEATKTIQHQVMTKEASKEDIENQREKLKSDQVLVLKKNFYKALGEIVVKKLGLEVPEDIFVKLMHLVHKDENKKGVSNNNYITAWTNSLYGNHEEANIQKVNKILGILYPIITGKNLEILKTGRKKNDPHYKEMFNKIKDALSKINSEFASLCMANNDKTVSTIELLNSKGMFVEKSGFTTSGETVYIFTHPIIQKINSLNPR